MNAREARIPESTIRSRAKAQGYEVRKDRAKTYSMNHQGGYQIINTSLNVIFAGENFDLDLDYVEQWLEEEKAS